MSEVTWNDLAKKVDDKTKISEETDAKLIVHNQDPSAHGQSDEGLYNHRVNETLDHPDSSVKSAKIDNLAVITAKINNLAVEAGKIKDLAVEEAKIGNLAVAEGKIKGLAVTEAKIGNLAVAEGKIKDLAVTTAKIKDLAVETAKIANLAVDTLQIAGNAVETAKIADLAVTEGKIDSLAVTEAKIDGLAVTEAKIGALAVTVGKIKDLAVETAKIKDLAVETVKIKNENVTNIKVIKIARAFKYIVDAAGNGDYTTIQPAINAANADGGGRIFIKAGTYILTADLTLYTNVQLIGEDADTTIIDCNSAAWKASAVGTAVTLLRNIRIEGLTFKDRLSNSHAAIYFEYVHDSEIVGCYFTNNMKVSGDWAFDLYFSNTYRIQVLNNRSVSSHIFAYLSGFVYGTISGNFILSTASYGIYISGCDLTHIESNIFYGCVGDAISVEDVIPDIVIRGNYGWSLGASAFNLRGADQCVIIGNRMDADDTAGYGVYLLMAYDSVISDNVFTDFGTDGIRLEESENVILEGNRVRSCVGWGININDANCLKNIVVANHLLGNTAGALRDIGVGTDKGHNIIA